MHNIVNVSNSTEVFALKWLIICYGNFTSVEKWRRKRGGRKRERERKKNEGRKEEERERQGEKREGRSKWA